MSDSEVSLAFHVQIINVVVSPFVSGDSTDVPFHARICSETGSWEIQKTCRDTIRLNKKLKRDPKFRGIEVPPPPDPNKVFSRNVDESEGREKIEQQLLKFLHHICHRTVLYTSTHVQRFLKTPKMLRRKSEQLRRSLAIPLKQGYLQCKLDEKTAEKKYYCNLFPNYSLSYHEDEMGPPIGVIDLSTAHRVWDIPKCDRFGIECGSVFMFTCETVDEKSEWLACFRTLIDNRNHSSTQVTAFLSELPEDKISITPHAPIENGDDEDEGEDVDMDLLSPGSPNGWAGNHARNGGPRSGSLSPIVFPGDQSDDGRVRRLSTDSSGSVTRSELKERLQRSHERECCLSDEVRELQEKLRKLHETSEAVRGESQQYKLEHVELIERCSRFEKQMAEAQERANYLQSRLEGISTEFREREQMLNQNLIERQTEIESLHQRLVMKEGHINELTDELSRRTVVQSGTLGKFQGSTPASIRYDKMSVKHVTFVSSTLVLTWAMDITAAVAKQCKVTEVSTSDDIISRNIVGNRSQRWFKVSSPSRIVVFVASSEHDRDQWVSVIQSALTRKKSRGSPRLLTAGGAPNGLGTASDGEVEGGDFTEPREVPTRSRSKTQ